MHRPPRRRAAGRLVGDLALGEAALHGAEQGEDGGVLHPGAELQHEGLDVVGVVGGVERGGVVGGKGPGLAAGERTVEGEAPEGGGGVLGLHLRFGEAAVAVGRC